MEENQDMWAGGIYRDQFVRTPEGWRFKELTFTRAFISMNEQGWRVG